MCKMPLHRSYALRLPPGHLAADMHSSCHLSTEMSLNHSSAPRLPACLFASDMHLSCHLATKMPLSHVNIPRLPLGAPLTCLSYGQFTLSCHCVAALPLWSGGSQGALERESGIWVAPRHSYAILMPPCPLKFFPGNTPEKTPCSATRLLRDHLLIYARKGESQWESMIESTPSRRHDVNLLSIRQAFSHWGFKISLQE